MCLHGTTTTPLQTHSNPRTTPWRTNPPQIGMPHAQRSAAQHSRTCLERQRDGRRRGRAAAEHVPREPRLAERRQVEGHAPVRRHAHVAQEAVAGGGATAAAGGGCAGGVREVGRTDFCVRGTARGRFIRMHARALRIAQL